ATEQAHRQACLDRRDHRQRLVDERVHATCHSSFEPTRCSMSALVSCSTVRASTSYSARIASHVSATVLPLLRLVQMSAPVPDSVKYVPLSRSRSTTSSPTAR